MAQLIYEITGDISGLQSAINQASNLIRDVATQSSQLKVADISPQIVAGVAALDQLDKKLLVITGNATLFGDSIKSQASQVSAYQGAINSLLANGFDPMDGDVQRLKQHVDALTDSLTAASNVKAPGRDFNNETTFAPGIAAVTNEPPANQAAISLVQELNAQLASGAITVQQYNEALLSANSTLNTLGQSATEASSAFENEIGIIAGLKKALGDLNTVRLNTLVEGDLPLLNAEIQETEIEISRLSNIGKVGFDQMGNSIRGVSVQNLNGQLVALSNNLFGARQISRDLVRTFDSTSVGTFARSIGLLAVDFLFFAQNAQFAKASTTGATAAIAVEGEVAAGSALSTGALGAAFASLLTPTSLIVLGIAAAGAAFIAYENSQKNASQTATEHLKAIQAEKQALADYISTLTPAQQVESAAGEAYAASTIKLNELVFAVKNNTGALFDGKTALEDLQALYPAFFSNLDEAATRTDKFTAATDAAKESLKALGEFTAANKLAQVSVESAVSNQAAANSLLAPLQNIKNQLDKATESFKKAGSQFTQSFSGPGQGGASNEAIGLSELQKQYDDLNEKIHDYNTTVAEANAKTQAFYDIANKNAPKAGLVTIKPDKGTDVVDQFATLSQKLDEITQKSSSLAGNTGISGYASEIAGIVKQFTELNNSVAQFTIQVNKAFDKGALTGAERDKLLAPLPAIKSALPGDENTALDQARIKNAQATSDAVQKINDQFGIKEQAGFNEELSRVKKLYDSIIEEADKSTQTLDQINLNYQNAVANAQGNPQALANAKLVYDAQIVQAQNANAKIVAARADLLPAIKAVDQKYIQQETETYGKITDIANQAFEALDTGEAARTDKINLEWQKRITAANAYFDKLRDLAKASNLPQSSTDQINAVQAQVNLVIKAANVQQVSEEISKNFASAMQSAVDGFVSNFYTSLTGLGQARQDIDNKYFSQLASASDQSAIDQINNLKRLEQQSTTSFGAIFSSLVSKFTQTFNESILNSFTKQFTENLGKTLLTPTAKQLTISPEQQAAQNVAVTLKGAGTDLAAQIEKAGSAYATHSQSTGTDFNTQVQNAGSTFAAAAENAGTAFAAKANGVPISPDLLSGASGGSQLLGAGNLAGAQIGNSLSTSLSSSSTAFSASIAAGAATAAGALIGGADAAGAKISQAGSGLSAKVAGLASVASLAGGLISGATSPTSSVGQGVGGALAGAGEGALIGSVIPGIGTLIGAVGGFIIGGISGLLSASKANKQEELQQKQLEAQQETNDLIARQNALAYTTSIVGRMTNQGIITGVDINSFGQLTATVSGKDLQFVLGRAANGR